MARASSREEHFRLLPMAGREVRPKLGLPLRPPSSGLRESLATFTGTFVGGVSPYFLKWNEAFLVLGMQFAGGVFLATALMHFLSDANEMFGNLTEKDYPFALMLACASYFLTMLAACALSYV